MAKKRGNKTMLGLHLKVYYKTGRVESFSVQKKLVFRYRLSRVDSKKVDHYYLRVTYFPGVSNDGEYFTKEDLLSAYSDFTNEDEVNYCLEYWDNGKAVAIPA